jgi:hypothetical protein
LIETSNVDAVICDRCGIGERSELSAGYGFGKNQIDFKHRPFLCTPSIKRAANRLPPALFWESEELYAKANEIVVVSNGDRRSLGDHGARFF